MEYADAHIHLTDPDISKYLPGDSCRLMFSCVARRSEWGMQSSLAEPRAVRFYGIHPWYADEWDPSIEKDLRGLLDMLPDVHVGEIGLDNKRGSQEIQMRAFYEQVRLASEFGRAVNVHNIGCDGDIVRILKSEGKGCRSIIMHSFRTEPAQFSGLRCFFSLNPRILSRSNDKVRRLVSAIGRDRLLLETDAPFYPGGTSLRSFIDSLSEITGMEAEELASLSLENARRALE